MSQCNTHVNTLPTLVEFCKTTRFKNSKKKEFHSFSLKQLFAYLNHQLILLCREATDILVIEAKVYYMSYCSYVNSHLTDPYHNSISLKYQKKHKTLIN